MSLGRTFSPDRLRHPFYSHLLYKLLSRTLLFFLHFLLPQLSLVKLISVLCFHFQITYQQNLPSRIWLYLNIRSMTCFWSRENISVYDLCSWLFLHLLTFPCLGHVNWRYVSLQLTLRIREIQFTFDAKYSHCDILKLQ